jgi:dihydrofolate reductase
MFSLIATIDANNGLNVGKYIPWVGYVNLGFFREKTRNSLIIMGRKTWESLPVKPMPDHINIVISKTLEMEINNKIPIPGHGNAAWIPSTNNPHFIFKSIINLLNWLEFPKVAEKYKNFNKFVIGGGMLFDYLLHEGLISVCYIIHLSISNNEKKHLLDAKLDMDYINEKGTSQMLYTFICDGVCIKIVKYILLCDIICSSKHMISSPNYISIQSPVSIPALEL